MSKSSLIGGAVVGLVALVQSVRDRLRPVHAPDVPADEEMQVLRLDGAAMADRDLLAQSVRIIVSMSGCPAWCLEIGSLDAGWGPYRQLMLLQALQAGTEKVGKFEIRLADDAGPQECLLAIQLAKDLNCDVAAHPLAMSIGGRTFKAYLDSGEPLPQGLRVMPWVRGQERSSTDLPRTYTVRLRDGVSSF